MLTQTYINKSINQSNFYSANIPGEARLSGATAKSVLNSKILESNINRLWGVTVSMGERLNQRDVSSHISGSN